MNITTTQLNKFTIVYDLTHQANPHIYTLKFKNKGTFAIHIEFSPSPSIELPSTYEFQLLKHPQFKAEFSDFHEIQINRQIDSMRIFCLQTFPEITPFGLEKIDLSEYETQLQQPYQQLFRQADSTEPGSLISRKLSKLAKEMNAMKLMLKDVKNEGFVFK